VDIHVENEFEAFEGRVKVRSGVGGEGGGRGEGG
jgi:hypothetical protein